jgi:hypothetical protein
MRSLTTRKNSEGTWTGDQHALRVRRGCEDSPSRRSDAEPRSTGTCGGRPRWRNRRRRERHQPWRGGRRCACCSGGRSSSPARWERRRCACSPVHARRVSAATTQVSRRTYHRRFNRRRRHGSGARRPGDGIGTGRRLHGRRVACEECVIVLRRGCE